MSKSGRTLAPVIPARWTPVARVGSAISMAQRKQAAHSTTPIPAARHFPTSVSAAAAIDRSPSRIDPPHRLLAQPRSRPSGEDLGGAVDRRRQLLSRELALDESEDLRVP